MHAPPPNASATLPKSGYADESPGLSILVPVYNSEKTLADLAARLEPILQGSGRDFELILINDGSRDGSWQVVRELVNEYPWIRGIDLMRNYGQHNALLCGLREARFSTAVTMDDDLQNPPEEIAKLLARLDEGFDVVYGPPEKQQHGFFRDLASTITKMVLQGAMGADTARHVSAFRAFRTRLRHAFDQFRGSSVNLDVLLTWSTTRFAAVKVRHDPRMQGKSNYTLTKLLLHALNMMTGFSTWPLRLATFVGFAFTLFGAGVLVFVVSRYVVQGTPMQGFPFLASIIAIFSGAQLFALGVIGEYLARIHLRGMERPTYAVRGLAVSDGGRS
jgi:glycosyltransferase involved in cell wall biosynthesis